MFTFPYIHLHSTTPVLLCPPSTPPSDSATPMAFPASYSGEAVECSDFLLQVALFIEMQPQKFPKERTKVAFLISLLMGRALLWAHIGHGTVRSICCLEQHSLRVECIHCPSWSARQWRSTSSRLYSNIHPTFHFTRRLQRLLRGEEGWRLEALHELLRPELTSGRQLSSLRQATTNVR